jgi:hypothetical protein
MTWPTWALVCAGERRKRCRMWATRLSEELHAVSCACPSGQVDVTGRAFLLVQPGRLAPHRTVKVDYRHMPSPTLTDNTSYPLPARETTTVQSDNTSRYSRQPGYCSPAVSQARDAVVSLNIPCRRRFTACSTPLRRPTIARGLRIPWLTTTTSHWRLQPTHMVIAIRPRSD